MQIKKTLLTLIMFRAAAMGFGVSSERAIEFPEPAGMMPRGSLIAWGGGGEWEAETQFSSHFPPGGMDQPSASRCAT